MDVESSWSATFTLGKLTPTRRQYWRHKMNEQQSEISGSKPKFLAIIFLAAVVPTILSIGLELHLIADKSDWGVLAVAAGYTMVAAFIIWIFKLLK
jgi:hypothetical protein